MRALCSPSIAPGMSLARLSSLSLATDFPDPLFMMNSASGFGDLGDHEALTTAGSGGYGGWGGHGSGSSGSVWGVFSGGVEETLDCSDIWGVPGTATGTCRDHSSPAHSDTASDCSHVFSEPESTPGDDLSSELSAPPASCAKGAPVGMWEALQLPEKARLEEDASASIWDMYLPNPAAASRGKPRAVKRAATKRAAAGKKRKTRPPASVPEPEQPQTPPVPVQVSVACSTLGVHLSNHDGHAYLQFPVPADFDPTGMSLSLQQSIAMQTLAGPPNKLSADMPAQLGSAASSSGAAASQYPGNPTAQTAQSAASTSSTPSSSSAAAAGAAATATADRLSTDSGPNPVVTCPHCRGQETHDASDSKQSRRRRRQMRNGRSKNKLGMWWKKYGYEGPLYCQRCSEIFRDHIIRQISNSAGCSRASPCVDCARILQHFKKPKCAVWELIATKCREKGVRAASAGLVKTEKLVGEDAAVHNKGTSSASQPSAAKRAKV